MGRKPCCSKEEGLNRGAWTAIEDQILTDYIKAHGEGKWRSIPKAAGLKRCGKSCRLRWLNYLRPDIKRGNITLEEEDLIIRLHKLLGNRWSLIAGRLPGRTDNEIKNYWNTVLSKRGQLVKGKGILLMQEKKQTIIAPKARRCSSSSRVRVDFTSPQPQAILQQTDKDNNIGFGGVRTAAASMEKLEYSSDNIDESFAKGEDPFPVDLDTYSSASDFSLKLNELEICGINNSMICEYNGRNDWGWGQGLVHEDCFELGCNNLDSEFGFLSAFLESNSSEDIAI